MVFAVSVTFFLIGAWHGQTGSFLFFGVLQGFGTGFNKLYQVTMANRLGRKQYRALCADPLYRAGARGLTFTWFAFQRCGSGLTGSNLGMRALMGTDVALLGWVVLFVLSTIVLSAWVALIQLRPVDHLGGGDRACCRATPGRCGTRRSSRSSRGHPAAELACAAHRCNFCSRDPARLKSLTGTAKRSWDRVWRRSVRALRACRPTPGHSIRGR